MEFLQFQNEAQVFLNKLEFELASHGVHLEKHWMVDHLCYRAASHIEYNFLKTQFSKFSVLMTESEVNGRPIATYKLKQGLLWRGQKIDVLELPAPKLGKTIRSGFEHIEIVCDLSFQELMARFKNLRLDTNGLIKHFNPELEIELTQCAIKFHHLSLESVVNFEKNIRVVQNRSLSLLLQTLKQYQPVLTGTLPLDLDTAESDCDIMITVKNPSEFDQLIESLKKNWEPQFSENFIELNCEDLKVEILCENIPSTQQIAFLHFLIEERLLRLGGENFKLKLKELRRQGLKTEPAFAKALSLAGDPYNELLKLQKLSDLEIQETLKGALC